MFKDYIENLITETYGNVEGHQVLEVKLPHKGDFSSNIAFLFAKEEGASPEDIGKKLLKKLPKSKDYKAVDEKGYINFFFSHNFIQRNLAKIFSENFGNTQIGKGRSILLEFVSANPTGPLNIVQARAGSYGSALANLLKSQGFIVETEYYINDAGGQVEKLEESLETRIEELKGKKVIFPKDGYKGEYLKDIAKDILKNGLPREKWLSYTIENIIASQKNSLEKMGVKFDKFVKESYIRESGLVDEVLTILKNKGLLYESQNALFFSATKFGDTKDRVLIKRDKKPTYFLIDLAYHLNKLRRGYDTLINIWGPDHYGYIPRILGGIEAMGYNKEKLKVLIIQQVTFKKGKEFFPMSKRKGEFISLNDILSLINKDALRFFLLMRKGSQHLNFDIELAQKLSIENPVYYAQYGHARIASILRKAKELGINEDSITEQELSLLSSPEERELMKTALYYEDICRDASLNFEPHQLTFYLLNLAQKFHYFYEKHKVIIPDESLRKARLFLCKCVLMIFKKGLDILGVSAPEKM